MQSRLEDGSELSLNPNSGTGFCDEFATKAKIEESEKFDHLGKNENDDDGDGDGDDDFTFASAMDFDSFASSTAEEMFHDGKIRPVFPLFDQSLVDLPQTPAVNKVFVEADLLQASVEGEAAGPYCAWSVAAASSPEACRKSNSTGFSKIWRFKEMGSRSNSDGRDAFVFLNKPTVGKKAKDSAIADKKVNESMMKKNGGKQKMAASSSSGSAHEVYVKSRAASREDDRRKSYLPYKPELVHGFFTNVHGGMSKNVHPF